MSFLEQKKNNKCWASEEHTLLFRCFSLLFNWGMQRFLTRGSSNFQKKKCRCGQGNINYVSWASIWISNQAEKCYESAEEAFLYVVLYPINNNRYYYYVKQRAKFYCVVTCTTKCIISLRQIERTIIKFSCWRSIEFVTKKNLNVTVR